MRAGDFAWGHNKTVVDMHEELGGKDRIVTANGGFGASEHI